MNTGHPWFRKQQLKLWNFLLAPWQLCFKPCYSIIAKWEQGMRDLLSFQWNTVSKNTNGHYLQIQLQEFKETWKQKLILEIVLKIQREGRRG